jgi:hypothetical protein
LVKISAVVLMLVAAALAGCAVHDTRMPELEPQAPIDGELLGEPDFNWHLSGDRRVAPRQIFSDQQRIWLQWHPHQAVPSVFVDDFGQWRVLEQYQRGQYTVIDGPWRRLRFQGGALRAMAVYRSEPAGVQPCLPSQPTTPSAFDARLSDGSVRQTLRRWADIADWFFDDSLWSLPVDFPVTAPATFHADFETAVRELLLSARVAGQSVKPCFYANHVLRVIGASQSCDAMADQGDRP